MAQPKYTIYKYVRFKDGSWRYWRAATVPSKCPKTDRTGHPHSLSEATW